jgi:hypothetical protein
VVVVSRQERTQPGHEEGGRDRRAHLLTSTTKPSCQHPHVRTHLPAALRPRADADGWYRQRLRHCCCNGGGHTLQHNCKAAAVLQGLGLIDDAHSLARNLGLWPEATYARQTERAASECSRQ